VSQTSSSSSLWVPATCSSSFLPFLDGLRQCAGQHLAEVEFAVLLYTFFVPYSLNVILPPVPLTDNSQNEVNLAPGGGTAFGARALARSPHSAIAVIADKRLPFSSHTRIDEEWSKHNDIPGYNPLTDRLRVHIVRRPDMFTSFDGNIPFEVNART